MARSSPCQRRTARYTEHNNTILIRHKNRAWKMLPELTVEELADAFDAVAVEILAEAGIVYPPVDAFAVARSLGLTVALDDAQDGRARYACGGPAAGRGRRSRFCSAPSPPGTPAMGRGPRNRRARRLPRVRVAGGRSLRNFSRRPRANRRQPTGGQALGSLAVVRRRCRSLRAGTFSN